ncbi:MAG: uracil-DNA glycosylase [Pyrinomonadaceae bacterium]|nr:uracil-DNA glycosylase [Pyrinomonadaceae bacterium]
MQNDLFNGSWELNAPHETLSEIKAEMIDKAKSIPELANRFFVFSQGDVNATIAVVGESPGPPDAAAEKPFQGPTGDLLNRILASIGLNRANTYLTNIVKYISAGDEITPELMKFFTPFVWRELAVVKPKVVLLLGNTPTKSLLNTKQPISKVRGEFHEINGLMLMPTFNPAYLLRDPTKKREVWEDVKRVRDFLKET